MVSCLGHVVILQQGEEPRVGGTRTADGGLQARKRRYVRLSHIVHSQYLHVGDDGAVSEDGHLLHLNPGHHVHAGHARSFPPHGWKVEIIVVQLCCSVSRQSPLYKLRKLGDVEAALAEPGEDR